VRGGSVGVCRLLETTSRALLPVTCHNRRAHPGCMHTNAKQRNSYGSKQHTDCSDLVHVSVRATTTKLSVCQHTDCSDLFRETFVRRPPSCLCQVCPSAPLLASVELRATNELFQKTTNHHHLSWLGILFAGVRCEFVVRTLSLAKPKKNFVVKRQGILFH